MSRPSNRPRRQPSDDRKGHAAGGRVEAGGTETPRGGLVVVFGKPPPGTRPPTESELEGLRALANGSHLVGMTRTLRIWASVVVPGLRLRSPNASNREDWTERKKRVDRERHAVTCVLRAELGARCPLALPVRVTVTRAGPRRFDRDNNVASMKAVIDAVCDYLGCDDGDEDRVTFAYEQRKQPRYAVELTVEENVP